LELIKKTQNCVSGKCQNELNFSQQKKLNNKERKIMLTVWREKMATERVKRGEIYICQELSFLVAICCRIPGVARQLCVRLSRLTDNAGMKFCGRRDAPTHSGSIRWISSDLKNLRHVSPLFHNLVCLRPFPHIFRFCHHRPLLFLYPDLVSVLQSPPLRS
jgi:hypothetical protein